MKKLRNSHVKIIHALADFRIAGGVMIQRSMRARGWFTGSFYISMMELVDHGFVEEREILPNGRILYKLTAKGHFVFLVGPSPRTTWIDRAWTRFERWSEKPLSTSI